MVPRYSRCAADRNRVKRRLREIVRLDLLPALRHTEFVLRALPSAYGATFSELQEQCMLARKQFASEPRHRCVAC